MFHVPWTLWCGTAVRICRDEVRQLEHPHPTAAGASFVVKNIAGSAVRFPDEYLDTRLAGLILVPQIRAVLRAESVGKGIVIIC
jgi:hypothetical protein